MADQYDLDRVPPRMRAAYLLAEVIGSGDENGALANATGDDLRDALALAAERLREPNRAAVQQAIDVLNRVHAADPTVLPALIAYRVPCNESVAEDPTVQVGTHDDARRVMMGTEVGLLGIINGLFGVDDRSVGFIAAYRDGDGNLTRFDWTTRQI